MLRKRSLRRTTGALLVIAGGMLMWLAPESMFGSSSIAGAALLIAGIVLEALGIALERRDRNRGPGRATDL